ncbi:MAG TPA: hypothetical protein VNY24_16620 [Candidatus Acidoferrales bacterium]|jgi:hypothetical protein|nr:hypothetical protein [Candidatus Acidoferrales bacterium]
MCKQPVALVAPACLRQAGILPARVLAARMAALHRAKSGFPVNTFRV